MHIKAAQLYCVKNDENMYTHKQLKGSTSHFRMPKKKKQFLMAKK